MAAGVPAEQLLTEIEYALLDATKYRSSAPGTTLSDGTVLAGGGIVQLAAAALSSIGLAGGTQVSAVQAAGATTIGQMQTLRSEALAFRNEARNAALQAYFGGYSGTFATRAAFGSPAGKAAGTYLVLADETHSGQPWAYMVASNAITASWGELLQNPGGGLDLLGPLVNRGTGDRTVFLIPKGQPNGVDFVITKYLTGNDGDPTRGNEVVNIGHNIGPGSGKLDPSKGALRIGMESNFHPFVGKMWLEFHLAAVGMLSGEEFRFLSMEMDADRTDGTNGKILRLRLAADLLNITDASAQKVLVFITSNQFSLQNRQAFDTTLRSGTLLQARLPGDGQDGGGTMDVIGVDGSVPTGSIIIGTNSVPTRIPQTLSVGEGGIFPARFTVHSTGAEGVQSLAHLRTNGAGEGAGSGVLFSNESQMLGRLSAVLKDGNGSAVYLENKGPGSPNLQRTFAAFYTGDVQVLVAGAGTLYTNDAGTITKRHRLNAAGTAMELVNV